MRGSEKASWRLRRWANEATGKFDINLCIGTGVWRVGYTFSAQCEMSISPLALSLSLQCENRMNQLPLGHSSYSEQSLQYCSHSLSIFFTTLLVRLFFSAQARSFSLFPPSLSSTYRWWTGALQSFAIDERNHTPLLLLLLLFLPLLILAPYFYCYSAKSLQVYVVERDRGRFHL